MKENEAENENVSEEKAKNRMEIKLSTPEDIIKMGSCLDVLENEVKAVLLNAQEMVKFAFSIKAAGLAANEVGLDRKFFVMLNNDGTWTIAINPTFFPATDSKKCFVQETAPCYKERAFVSMRHNRGNGIFYIADFKTGKLKKTVKPLNGTSSFLYQRLLETLEGKVLHQKDSELKKNFNKIEGKEITIKGKKEKIYED